MPTAAPPSNNSAIAQLKDQLADLFHVADFDPDTWTDQELAADGNRNRLTLELPATETWKEYVLGHSHTFSRQQTHDVALGYLRWLCDAHGMTRRAALASLDRTHAFLRRQGIPQSVQDVLHIDTLKFTGRPRLKFRLTG